LEDWKEVTSEFEFLAGQEGTLTMGAERFAFFIKKNGLPKVDKPF
jgi:hypothetical protein